MNEKYLQSLKIDISYNELINWALIKNFFIKLTDNNFDLKQSLSNHENS